MTITKSKVLIWTVANAPRGLLPWIARLATEIVLTHHSRVLFLAQQDPSFVAPLEGARARPIAPARRLRPREPLEQA